METIASIYRGEVPLRFLDVSREPPNNIDFLKPLIYLRLIITAIPKNAGDLAGNCTLDS
jgi:hypothetical protein